MNQKRAGLFDIKTPQKSKTRSIPKAGGNYLDLYMLIKEKERLEQEKANVDKRKKQLETNLKEINKEIKKLGESLSEEKMELPGQEKEKKRKIPGKPMKTMTLNY